MPLRHILPETTTETPFTCPPGSCFRFCIFQCVSRCMFWDNQLVKCRCLHGGRLKHELSRPVICRLIFTIFVSSLIFLLWSSTIFWIRDRQIFLLMNRIEYKMKLKTKPRKLITSKIPAPYWLGFSWRGKEDHRSWGFLGFSILQVTDQTLGDAVQIRCVQNKRFPVKCET